MKLLVISLFFIFVISSVSHSQDNTLPYDEIPPAPEVYSAGTVASRMVDGLGFRYYWATEGLRSEDLQFRPNADARTSQETLEHIYELSIVIVKAVTHEVIDAKDEGLTFEELRGQTLRNIAKASDILRLSSGDQMMEHKMVFKGKDQNYEYPFWNLLNGPIADAIWHCGQVVSFRRSSGNPFNSKVSVLNGKLRQ